MNRWDPYHDPGGSPSNSRLNNNIIKCYNNIVTHSGSTSDLASSAMNAAEPPTPDSKLDYG